MKKVERLAIAGHAAPRLRAQAARRVGLVNDRGEIVGYVDLKKVQTALLEKEAIAIQVEGRRPCETTSL